MTPTPPPAPDYPPAKPATSVGQVFALVAGFLALAAIGAAIGWAVTDTGGSPQQAASVIPSTPALGSPTPTPTPAPTVGPTSFVVPNFNAAGTDFITARSQLIAKKVAVLLEFHATSGGTGVVVRTDPAAGTVVNRGQTIKVYVNEAPPVLPVPNVVSTSCSAAKTTLVAAGFNLHYANGKVGIVMAQDPTSDSQDAHWNDTVALLCTVPPSSPPAVPSGPPSAGVPSPSASAP